MRLLIAKLQKAQWAGAAGSVTPGRATVPIPNTDQEVLVEIVECAAAFELEVG